MNPGEVQRAGGERAPRTLLWVLLLVAGALAVGFLYRPQGTASEDVRRSYFRTTPDGVAAFARVVESMGVPVAPRITPLVEADPVRGTVVLLDPRLPPTPREARALLDHVRAGGALIYGPTYRTGPSGTVRTQLMDSLGVRFRLRTTAEDISEMTLSDPSWGDHALVRDLPEPQPGRHGFRLRDDTAVLLTGHAPSGDELYQAAALELGDGHVLVLADAQALSNGSADEDPLAVAAVRAALAWTADADTVFFAEFHQGVQGRQSSAEVVRAFFLDRSGGRTLLQVLAVVCLALACAGARFGAPVPAIAPPDRERRSPLEHVSALGDLYRKAGASSTAALLLVGRLARAAHRPPPRTLTEARALLQELDARSTGSPLADAAAALRSESPDPVALAAGIDNYLARRSST